MTSRLRREDNGTGDRHSVSDIRQYVWLLGIFAGIAGGACAAGVYGVVSFATASRAREFGLRMALGAAGHQILGMVVAHGL